MQPEFHYGFTEAKSDKGVTYYVNDATGETSWEKPATGDIHGALAPAKAVVKAVAISAPGGPSGAPPIRSPPPGSIGGIQLVSIQAGSQQIAAGLQSLDKDAPVIEPFEISTIWFCRPCYHEKREATFFPGMIKFKHTKKLLCYPEEDSEVFVLRHDVIHTTFRKSLKSKWAIFAPILNALTLIVPLIILACLVAMIQTCSMVPTVAGCEACVNIEDATSASAGFKTCNRKVSVGGGEWHWVCSTAAIGARSELSARMLTPLSPPPSLRTTQRVWWIIPRFRIRFPDVVKTIRSHFLRTTSTAIVSPRKEAVLKGNAKRRPTTGRKSAACTFKTIQ